MPCASERAKMIAAARSAHARHERTRAQQAGDTDRLPSTGDVYRLKATSGHDVAWSVVVHDPVENRYLVVPIDTGTQVGTADVVIQDDEEVSPRVARCRQAAWVASEAFDHGHRVDALNEMAVGHIRAKWCDLGDGRATGNALQEDTDEDPEYEDWIEDVVAPARNALAPIVRPGTLPSVVSLAAVPALRRYALAATAIVALGAALAGAHFLRQEQRIRDLAEGVVEADQLRREAVARVEDEHRRELELLEGIGLEEKATLEARFEAALQRALEDTEKTKWGFRRLVSHLRRELEAAQIVGFAVNPVVRYIQRERSSIEVDLDQDASHLMLVFFDEGLLDSTSYRFSIYQHRDTSPLWSTDRLRQAETGEIWVGLPLSMIGPGEYLLELYRLQGEVYESYARHHLVVRSGNENSAQ